MPQAPAPNIVQTDAAHFPVPVGDLVQVEPDGLELKLKSRLVGLEKKSYLIVSLEEQGLDSKTVQPFLVPDNPVRIYHTREGVLRGWLTRVLNQTATPYRHLYLAYPHQAEFCSLRGHARMDCHLQAHMTLGGKERRGLIVNLSGGGAAVSIDWVPEGPWEEPLPEERCALTFSLLPKTPTLEMDGLIKSCRILADKTVLGLAFSDAFPRQTRRIQEFVDYVRRHKAGR